MSESKGAYRSWPGTEPEPKTYKMSYILERGTTITDLVHWCHDRGLDPAETIVTGGHIQYERTETPEEVQKRVEGARESEARHMQWVRDRYEFYFGEGKES